MLDDHTGRHFKALDAFPRSIGVGNVVVAQFLALQLHAGGQRTGSRRQIAVPGGLLVAVFAVAQVLHLHVLLVELAGEFSAGGHVRFAQLVFFKSHGRQVVADCAVVLADAVECSDRQAKTQLVAELAVGLEFGQHRFVLVRSGDHAHVFPVLGGRAHHGGAANVDVLDGVRQCATGLGHGRFEGVEVHHQQVDGLDAVFLQRCHVLGNVAAGQQASVHLGVQGLDAAVQHFRELGDFGDFGHGQALVGQQLGRAASRQQLHAHGVQGLRKFNDAGLVRDGEQCFHGATQ